MLWTRELVIETIENLAMSQGFYGRFLKFLEDVQEVNPEEYDNIMEKLVESGGPVNMVMMIEGGT